MAVFVFLAQTVIELKLSISFFKQAMLLAYREELKYIK